MVKQAIHIALCTTALLPARISAQDSTACFSGNMKACSKANGMITAWEAPANTGKMLLRNAGLWFSANDVNGVLRVAAHAFDNSGTDFTPGPLAPADGVAANPAAWNKVYLLSDAQVYNHRMNFRNEGYQMAPAIAQWPGNGSGTFAKILAPFVDYGSFNEQYEPASGDYPYITGSEVMYTICNDGYTSHSYSKGQPLGIEVQTMFYRYNAPSTDTVHNNTVMARIVVHNRSTRNYGNFRMSLVVNHILGNANDNFLTTDVKHQSVICYNGNDSDNIYGKLPPAFATVLLNKTLHSSMYLMDNSGQINSKPVLPAEFQNLMSGMWRNGKQLVYGGQGIDNGLPARYIYPDNQDPAFAGIPWTEDLVGNTPGYRIALLNTDSTVLNSNATIVYEVAFVFVDKKTKNLEQIRASVGAVKSAYERGELTGVKKECENIRLKCLVYPNPVMPGNTVFFDGFEGLPEMMEILDGNMRPVMNKKLLENEKSIILDKDFESGLYFIHLKTSEKAYLQRIIIQSN